MACAAPVTFWHRVSGYEYWRCSRCGSLRLLPLPADASLEVLYQQEISWTSQRAPWLEDAGADRREAQRRMRILASVGCRFGRVLEVGAGRGALAEAMRAAGAQVTVCEASETCRRRLSAQGFEVLNQLPADGRQFDLVVLWGVIEHLPDPRGLLNAITGLMIPGGRLAVYTEDVSALPARLAASRWHWLLPPEHVGLYSRIGMKALLECCGLALVGDVADRAQVRSLLMSALGARVGAAGRRAFRGARRGTYGRGGSSRATLVQGVKRLLDRRVPWLSEHRLYIATSPTRSPL